MSAKSVAGVFSGLLDHLDGIAASDTLNPDPKPYDEASEATAEGAFLSTKAIPKDWQKAVVIGVIDDAMPFAHQRLSIKGKDARVASIWMQGAAYQANPLGGVGTDLPFGAELRGGRITDLLGRLGTAELPDEGSLYRETGAVDYRRGTIQSGGFFGNHGAAVVDLAAGFAPDDADARNFPVMAVSLPPEITRDTLGTFSPIFVIMGVLHLVHRTRRLCRWIEQEKELAANSVKLPLVVNLSYGVSAGPKDGTGLVEAVMDAIAAETETGIGPITFVLPMGNQRLSRLHGVLDTATDATLGWALQPDDPTPSFVEIWGPELQSKPANCMQVTLRNDDAPRAERTSLKKHGTYQTLHRNGAEVARAYLQYHATGPNGVGREVITLAVPPTRPETAAGHSIRAGTWQIGVETEDRDKVDVYVQRDDAVRGFRGGGRQSKLVDDAYATRDARGAQRLHDPAGTETGVMRAGSANAFANGALQIRVGGGYGVPGPYGVPGEGDSSAVDPELGPAPYSSLGLASQDRPMEGDTIAPTERSAGLRGIITMGAMSGSRQANAGTSMASPKVARDLAEALSKGELPRNSTAALREAFLAR